MAVPERLREDSQRCEARGKGSQEGAGARVLVEELTSVREAVVLWPLGGLRDEGKANKTASG